MCEHRILIGNRRRCQEAARRAAEKAETPAETRARLEREAAVARNAISAAVKEALHGTTRPRHGGAPAAAPLRTVGMLGAMLAADSDDSGSEIE